MNTITLIKHLHTQYALDIRSAVAREERDGFEYEDTIDRIRAKGACDALEILALSLGLELGLMDSDKIERETREKIRRECEHDRYSTTPYPSEEIPEASEIRCDNCNTVLNWTL